MGLTEEGPATVRADVTGEPPGAVITFIDHGKPYDPLTADAPDTTLPAKKRRIGGRCFRIHGRRAGSE